MKFARRFLNTRNCSSAPVGDTTDVVQKEMYTFDDKGGRSITLRPEGTAGAVRAFLEHGLHNEALPQKVCYLTSCYRYEKPQAGRLREFHQFGVECLGAAAPAADAEIISMASNIFDYLGIEHLHLELNSIAALPAARNITRLCIPISPPVKISCAKPAVAGLARNPMRILDCKSPVCQEIAQGAPLMLDYLCDDCRAHFGYVKTYLDAMDIEYTINPRIVRGLDYYTRTVFEFVSDEIGAQGTVCGGGRYDGLVEELGGPHVPSLGFAMGLERLMLLMETQKTPFPQAPRCDLYIASMGDKASVEAVKIVASIREDGMSAQYDLADRSVKAQMKYANKLGARYTMVLGDNELETGKAILKNMESGETQEVALSTFAEDFMGLVVHETADQLADFINEENAGNLQALFGGNL